MVQVVGKSDKFVKEVVCRNCSSELRYTNSDVHTVHSKDYGGGADGQEYIRCPACVHKVVLKAW